MRKKNVLLCVKDYTSTFIVEATQLVTKNLQGEVVSSIEVPREEIVTTYEVGQRITFSRKKDMQEFIKAKGTEFFQPTE